MKKGRDERATRKSGLVGGRARGKGEEKERDRGLFSSAEWRTQRREPREKSAWILATTRHGGEKKMRPPRASARTDARAKGGRRDTAKPMFSMKGNMKYESTGSVAVWNEKGSISGRFCATGANMLIKFMVAFGDCVSQGRFHRRHISFNWTVYPVLWKFCFFGTFSFQDRFCERKERKRNGTCVELRWRILVKFLNQNYVWRALRD